MMSTQCKKKKKTRSLKCVASCDNKELVAQLPLGNFSIQLSMFSRTAVIFGTLPFGVHVEDMLHRCILFSDSLKIQFSVINHEYWEYIHEGKLS